MVDKKYELVREDSKVFLGKTLFRVRALVSGEFFVKGELGNFVKELDE